MKIGLYYEDITSGEILKCINFTRSQYVFKNKNGELIIKEKTNNYKRITSKRKINEFENII